MGSINSKEETEGEITKEYAFVKLKDFRHLFFVNYSEDKIWHRYYRFSYFDLVEFYIGKEDFHDANKFIVDKDLENYKAERVQISPEHKPRVDSGPSYRVNKNVERSLGKGKVGWVKITNNDVLKDFEYHEIEYVENKNYKDYIDDLGLDPNIIHVFKLSYNDYYKESDNIKYNLELDLSTSISEEKAKEYDYHLSHAVPKIYASNVIKEGKICIDHRCPKAYDESTGIFLGNQDRGYFNYQYPGIYMELFQHSRIKPYSPPMRLEDEFKYFRDLIVDTAAGIVYGEVGFIFPFEEILGKFKVDLKEDFYMGKGKTVSLDSFLKKYSGEAVVRANSLDINKISAMYIKFTYTEIDFIYDKLGQNEKITFMDIISLYLKFRRKDPESGKYRSPWFVRKSTLKYVLEGYNIKNIKSDNLKKLPLVYAVTPGRGTFFTNSLSIYNDPKLDIESDWDTFDPNIIN